MDRQEKQYKIGRATYIQRELTWKQDGQIMRMIGRAAGRFNANDILEIQAEKVITFLTRYNLLGEFFGIVLTPVKDVWYYFDRGKTLALWALRIRRGSWRQISIDDAPNSLIGEMMEDFFLSNSSLMKKLSGLENSFASIAKMAMQEKGSKEKASI